MRILFLLLCATFLFASNYDAIHEAVSKKDIKRAISLSRIDALSGNTKAMYNLSLLYLSEDNLKKAKPWLKKCVDKKYQRAFFVEGIITLEGRRDRKSLLSAKDSFKKSLTTTSSKAFINVIDDYLDKRKEASFEDYLTVASWYYKDKKLHNNYSLAIQILTRAADRGCYACMAEMGEIYKDKRITRTYYSDAIYSMNKAVEQKNIKAMRITGQIYVFGPRELRNLNYGQKLLYEAYLTGDKFAGTLYANSILSSTNGNYTKAIKILRDSTDSCYSNKVFSHAYKNGYGVVQDFDKLKFYDVAYKKCLAENEKFKDNLPLVIY